VRQKGSHRFWRLPDGAMVGSLAGDARSVPSSLIRMNAQAMGISYGELRARLGKPIPVRNRGRAATPKAGPSTGASKRTVLKTADEVAALVDAARATLLAGHRDPAYYEAAMADLVVARKVLAELNARANGKVDHDPDGTTYHLANDVG
jgi:hypothetical protein